MAWSDVRVNAAVLAFGSGTLARGQASCMAAHDGQASGCCLVMQPVSSSSLSRHRDPGGEVHLHCISFAGSTLTQGSCLARCKLVQRQQGQCSAFSQAQLEFVVMYLLRSEDLSTRYSMEVVSPGRRSVPAAQHPPPTKPWSCWCHDTMVMPPSCSHSVQGFQTPDSLLKASVVFSTLHTKPARLHA